MMSGGGYNQGDIVLVDFPFTNLTGSKPRPVIIISNSQVNKTLDVVCAQITSQPYKDDFSFEILDKHVTKPLGGYNEIRCHKIMTIEKTKIRKGIPHLHKTIQPDLFKKIKSLF